MADTGAHSGGTFSSDGGGDVAWSNPGNVAASDDSRATSACAAGENTDGLHATNFGFDADIGASDTIDGVLVQVERQASANIDHSDLNIQLIVGGVETGENKATGSSWPTTEATASYGGAADKWTLSLTATQVRATNFGISVSAGNGSKSTTFGIDHITMTVYYTAAGGGGRIMGGIGGRGGLAGSGGIAGIGGGIAG